MEIINSFELQMFDEKGIATVNKEFLNDRMLQCTFISFLYFSDLDKEVFPELDLIGWYSTDESAPSVTEMSIQKTFSSLSESPVFLKLDTRTSEGTCTKVRMSDARVHFPFSYLLLFGRMHALKEIV